MSILGDWYSVVEVEKIVFVQHVETSGEVGDGG